MVATPAVHSHRLSWTLFSHVASSFVTCQSASSATPSSLRVRKYANLSDNNFKYELPLHRCVPIPIAWSAFINFSLHLLLWLGAPSVWRPSLGVAVKARRIPGAIVTAPQRFLPVPFQQHVCIFVNAGNMIANRTRDDENILSDSSSKLYYHKNYLRNQTPRWFSCKAKLATQCFLGAIMTSSISHSSPPPVAFFSLYTP